MICGLDTAGKWLGSSGLIFTVSGLLQLEVSNLVQAILKQYMDSEREASSSVTRQIIDNPDGPIKTTVRNLYFFDPRTGLWLIIFGTVVQVVAVWV